MAKELEGSNAEIHKYLLRTTVKNIKLETAWAWWNTWILAKETHHHSLNWTVTYKKHTYPNGWPKEIPQWSKKVPLKETAPNNYRRITCLPMMSKILMAQIREVIYCLLTSRRLFTKKQKGCHKNLEAMESYSTLIKILNKNKMGRKNLAMAWIDYKNEYGMVQQSWIMNCFKMYKISDCHKLCREKHENTEIGIDSRRESLTEVKIQRGIFQGNAPSPLPFIIAIMPLNLILRKCKPG